MLKILENNLLPSTVKIYVSVIVLMNAFFKVCMFFPIQILSILTVLDLFLVSFQWGEV